MESYGLTVGRPGRVTGARIETCHARHVVYYDQSRPGRVTGARIETSKSRRESTPHRVAPVA